MKKLSKEEFNDRINAIQRAQRIFIDSGLTKNISIAFEIYQEVFAERERELVIGTKFNGRHAPLMMDKYERPRCECGFEMFFRGVSPNDEGIKAQLVCMNPKCDIVLNSDNDIEWWKSNLKVKDEHN